MTLQLMDVASTNHVLKIGGHEANPLMVAAQFNLGAQWWLPKLMLAAAACLLLLRRLQIWAIISFDALMLLVVINNWFAG
jgi:hypothetical protein